MARVNVEDGALPRINKLAGLMGVSDREAAGTVYMLWRDSQDVLACTGDREDMIDWAHLYGMDDAQVDRWLHALERARFISFEDDGLYRIHGNDVQIESRVSRLHKATKGAKATKDKWDRIKQAGLEPTPSTLPSVPHEAQSKPIQSSAIQTSASQCSGEPPLQPQLQNLGLENFLSDIPANVIQVWIRNHGDRLVRQLPACEEKWLADSKRSSQGDKALYITTWLRNSIKDEKNAARAGPKADVDLEAALKRRDAEQKASGAA